LLALAACAARPPTARRWAQADLDCPAESLEVRHLDLGIFEVEGCGQRALYRCPNREACERIDDPAALLPPAP